jgi:translation initiation factor 1
VKNNPFGDLRKQLGLPEPVEPVEPVEPAGAPVKRAVVRYERAGRGGKEVTVIEQLGLSQADLDAWLKQLKSTLGCGGSLDDGAIVLQGDHRKRLPQILTAQGVRKVIVG